MRRENLAPRNGGLAQLVEHLLCTQGVKGSSPSSSKKIPTTYVVGIFFRTGTLTRLFCLLNKITGFYVVRCIYRVGAVHKI